MQRGARPSSWRDTERRASTCTGTSDLIPGSEVCASATSLSSPGSGTMALAPTQGYGKHVYSRHPLWEQSSDLGC